jgi:hypothetical protein
LQEGDETDRSYCLDANYENQQDGTMISQAKCKATNKGWKLLLSRIDEACLKGGHFPPLPPFPMYAIIEAPKLISFQVVNESNQETVFSYDNTQPEPALEQVSSLLGLQ